MDGKNSFILYCDIGQHLELLSDEDAGLLFKGIVHYADTGEPPQLPPMAAMAFSFIRAQIDRDQEKWNTTREKRRAAGKSGGLKSGESRQRSNEAKEANASNPKQNEADEADNVNVTVPVNGNVPVIVINNGAPRSCATTPRLNSSLTRRLLRTRLPAAVTKKFSACTRLPATSEYTRPASRMAPT